MSRQPLHRKVLNAAAGLVTTVAVVGALGLLPGVDTDHGGEAIRLSSADAAAPSGESAEPTTSAPEARSGGAAEGRKAGRSAGEPVSPTPSPTPQDTTARQPAAVAPLPAASGSGRRIVFDQSSQRVWLVGGSGRVRRTYPVSGSVTDNLSPGTYHVYSRSRWAVGVDDSGVMQYYVRFAHGERSTIGFHTIPTHLGRPLQSVRELGTPQSHGCIRQRTRDAIALWHFAPVGTTVVVTA